MFRHYFITALRAFYKRKGGRGAGVLFTYINIFGLTVGLAAFLVIAHIVHYELSFDTFFENSKDTYRVAVKKTEQGNVVMESARSYPGLATLLKNEIPEVAACARLYKEECMLHYKEGDVKFNRQHTFWADRNFISVFNLEFTRQGDLTLLDKPWSAIISESGAKRFFGTDWEGEHDPIGKTIWLNENLGFTIQGVYKDLPVNSHMKVDFVVSWSTLVTLAGPVFENSLPPDWNASYVYLQLTPGTSPEKVETMAAKILKDRIHESVTRDVTYEFYLQPVESIHLHSNIADELQPNGSRAFVYSMIGAAALILVIAWINFTNLLTVRSLERAKEVGVRKAIGSTRRQLMIQFLFEAMLSSLAAGALALGIVYFSGNMVHEITQIQLPVFALSGQGTVILILFSIIIFFGGLVASLYPSLGLSALRTTEVIKGKVNAKPGKAYFRKTLLAFQFFCSVFLLTTTLVIYKQVKFMRSQELGMNPDQVIVLHSPRSMIGNDKRIQYFENLREKLLPFAEVKEVGASGCIPGNEFLVRKDNVQAAGGEDGKNITYDVAYIDRGYAPALGIRFLDGRNFTEQPGEETKIIINETAARMMNFAAETAVGKTVMMENRQYQVIGVVEDTHYQGLQKSIHPLILLRGHDYEFGFFPIKVQSHNMPQTVANIEMAWKEIYPNDPFDYFFLDSFFDEQYARDKAFGKLFGLFAVLGITIACLGLIGLVAYTTFQKTKEIGIRKILGANVWTILVLLTREFSMPVLIACVVAIPATQYTVQQWLEGFAYRYDVSWGVHFISLAVVNMLALLAISWQSLKAAFANPVDALRE
ncbi:MAG: ABC transporter permease [Cyclobacteriaceae bacterium]|nr:ABC transporter permease [Cyclobacteriaceae bacterium]